MSHSWYPIILVPGLGPGQGGGGEIYFGGTGEFWVGVFNKTIQRRLAKLEEISLVSRSGRGEGTRYAVASLHDVEQGEVRAGVESAKRE